jgi:hypothetical protein
MCSFFNCAGVGKGCFPDMRRLLFEFLGAEVHSAREQERIPAGTCAPMKGRGSRRVGRMIWF